MKSERFDKFDEADSLKTVCFSVIHHMLLQGAFWLHSLHFSHSHGGAISLGQAGQAS